MSFEYQSLSADQAKHLQSNLPSFQASSPQARRRIARKICDALQVTPEEISHLNRLKAGMTNDSYYFELDGVGHVYREAGAGTSKMIDRTAERDISLMMSETGLSDKTVHFNPDTGDRICVFFHGARNADPLNDDEVRAGMEALRKLHALNLSCDRTFSLRAEIAKYIKLCEESHNVHKALLPDYQEVEARVERVLGYLDSTPHKWCFCHIDGVPDNMIFLPDNTLKLIDWEYAGMCDPLIDPVMYGVYAGFDDERTEWLWETFLQRTPTPLEHARLTGLTACAGFLWSLWCAYKYTFGVEFGEYAQSQYDFAVRYSARALEEFERLDS